MGILTKRGIVITRDISQAGSLKERLEVLGAEVYCIPTIKIVEPDDWKPFDRAASSADRFDWLVFTSPNAAVFAKKRLDFLGIDRSSFSRCKVATIGRQTSRIVESFGWEVHLTPDRFQSENLSERLVSVGVRSKRVWLPRALVARNLLLENLEKAGAETNITPVYQNRIPYENRELISNMLDRRDIDWITFTSSSTVSNFFAICGETKTQRELPKLASIGAVTTGTLARFGLVPAFSAEPQNIEGLCQGIVDWEREHMSVGSDRETNC